MYTAVAALVLVCSLLYVEHVEGGGHAMKKKTTCERQTMELSCPANEVLKIIWAVYGRTNSKTCASRYIKTTDCRSNVLTEVQAICEDKQSCSVRAANSVFGDPCGGTYKFLIVSYECEDKCASAPPCQNSGVMNMSDCSCACPTNYYGDVCNQTCGGTFTDWNGTLSSPGYPNPYPNNVECEYLIDVGEGRSLQYDVQSMDIADTYPCPNDWLEHIQGGKNSTYNLGRQCDSTVSYGTNLGSLYIKFKMNSIDSA